MDHAGPEQVEVDAAAHLPLDHLDAAHLVVTHDGPVTPAVWDLWSATLASTGPVPTLLEWDDKIPSFPDLVRHLGPARRLVQNRWHSTEREAATAGG